MRVRFTDLALDDLERIAAYIAEHSETAARRVVNRIEDVCDRLGDTPKIGRLSEVPPARKLTVPPWHYQIIYQVHEPAGEVVILRVYHGSRNIPF